MTDELWQHSRDLSAERQRQVPAVGADTHPAELDLRELVKVLAEWIANPGPTDAERAAHNDHLETP